MRHLLQIFLILALAACSVGSTVAKVDGQGFGGSDQFAAAVANTHARAKYALNRLNQFGDALHALCAPVFCGKSGELCSDLGDLAANIDERLFLDASYLTPAAFSSQASALARMDSQITSDPTEVTVGGQVQAVLTVGSRVRFYRPLAETMSSDELVAVWLREAARVEGLSFTDPAGPLADSGTALKLRAECEVAYLRQGEGETAQSGEPALPLVFFEDRFPGSSLSNSWIRTTGTVQISGGKVTPTSASASSLAVNSQQDQRIRAQIFLDPSAAGGSAARLIARADYFKPDYQAEIATSGGVTQVSLFRVDNGTDNLLASATVDGTSGELVLEPIGNQLRVFWRGLPVLQLDDPGSSVASGHCGFSLRNASLAHFFAQSP